MMDRLRRVWYWLESHETTAAMIAVLMFATVYAYFFGHTFDYGVASNGR